jgi:2-polyprenyl-3-methyl-5-hydroxy-6-metoxy-1,4-benzoquinol methylase
MHGQHLAETGNPEMIWNWGTPAGKVRVERRARLLAETASLKPGMKIMEVGCGTGLFTELFVKYGAHLIAIDISHDLLKFAKERNLPSDLVEFRMMRFEDGDAERQFDAIIGSSVLHHLDMLTALKRMYDLLIPGGIIAFAEPNMLNPQIWIERNIPAVRKALHVSPDETAIIRFKLKKILEDLGFVDVNIRNVDWLHPLTPESLVPLISNIGLVLEKIPIIREFSGSVLIRAKRPSE